jgi:hypothetical protein
MKIGCGGTTRVLTILLATALAGVAPSAGAGQDLPERAVRRTIPVTDAIHRAMQAGTRDSTGAPGPNYWQLRTDYDIDVRLDPGTQTLTGRETIRLHNESPDPLELIALRLDHNIFRPRVPRGFSVPA